MHKCLHIYIFKWKHACIHVYTCVCLATQIHTFILHTYIFMNACSIYVYIDTYINAYIQTHGCLCIHLYIFACIYATVHKGMSFLDKVKFCSSTPAQLCHLCLVIQSNMWTIITIIFLLLLNLFSFSSALTSEVVSDATVSGSLVVYSTWCGCCYGCYILSFWFLVYSYHSVEPG